VGAGAGPSTRLVVPVPRKYLERVRRIMIVAAVAAGIVGGPTVPLFSADSLLVDDFALPGESSLGTRWQAFTDGVMGGQSRMDAGFVLDGDTTVLRMTGSVSLANNGGFIQVRLPLTERGFFDASAYSAIAVETRGRPGMYYIHIRSQQTRLPWQHFKAPVPLDDTWQRTVVPFSSFLPDSVRGPLDASRLTSVGIVAGGAAFDGDISIRRIEFVP
jgi:hypothetical protein